MQTSITFEQLVAVVAAIAVPLLVAVIGYFFKERATERQSQIQRWIVAAYHITTEVSKLTPTKVDDKIAYALGVLAERLSAAGVAVTPAVEAQARATWTAMSGEEKRAVSVAAKADALKVAPVDPTQAPAAA